MLSCCTILFVMLPQKISRNGYKCVVLIFNTFGYVSLDCVLKRWHGEENHECFQRKQHSLQLLVNA